MSLLHLNRCLSSRGCFVVLIGLLGAATASAIDTDGDGIDDILDNCPFVTNALQPDTDLDGVEGEGSVLVSSHRL